MKRGKVLAAAASLTGTATISERSTAASKQGSAPVDVAVIGAGLAGLTAARDLALSGLRTVVIEARDRLGGRTVPNMIGTYPVDSGGTWFHWFQSAIWREIQRYELDVVELPAGESYVMSVGGKRVEVPTDRLIESLRKSLPIFWGDPSYRVALDRPFQVKHHPEELARLDKLSVEDRLKQIKLDPFDEGMLRGLFIDYGRPPSDVSLPWILQRVSNSAWSVESFLSIDGMFKIKDGTKALANALVKEAGCEVMLSSPVSGVEWNASGCSVELADGRRIAARAAVVATPASIWKTIRFSPSLPDAHAEASAEGMSSPKLSNFMMIVNGLPKVLKVMMPHGTFPLEAVFTCDVLPDGRQTIHGFSMGGGVTMAMGRDALQSALRLVAPTAEIVDYVGHDWASDPFALGGHPTLKVGQMARFIDVLDRGVGRLFFATSDIAAQFSGFLSGALESGARAAYRVEKVLKQ
jgi:monoamine oxidase